METAAWSTPINLLLSRIDRTCASRLTGFPHYADGGTGDWTTTPTGDWTGGYWVGELWLGSHLRQDAQLREEARSWLSRLEERVHSPTVFRGFLFYYGAALGAMLAGDSRAAELAREAASSLAGTYRSELGLLPLGEAAEESSSVGDRESNIDGLIATPLMLWAHAEQPNPHLLEVARGHARRTGELLVREDGSVCQSVSLDPAGQPLRWYTHKGAHDGSTWARAQAWAMLCYSLAALWDPDEPLHVEFARRTADWWLGHVPRDHVAYWDFDVPQRPPSKRDTSATAIAAAAMLKLARVIPDVHGDRYRAAAQLAVDALIERHVTPSGLLVDGCFNHRDGVGVSAELIWGDYYLLEALAGLDGRFEMEGAPR